MNLACLSGTTRTQEGEVITEGHGWTKKKGIGTGKSVTLINI
jgi:hypothetical protein